VALDLLHFFQQWNCNSTKWNSCSSLSASKLMNSVKETAKLMQSIRF